MILWEMDTVFFCPYRQKFFKSKLGNFPQVYSNKGLLQSKPKHAYSKVRPIESMRAKSEENAHRIAALATVVQRYIFNFLFHKIH